MTDAADRRRFLKSTAAAAAWAALRPGLSAATNAPRAAIPMASLPPQLPIRERFDLAVRAGFAGVEMRTVADPAEAEEVREAARRAGVRIHAVVDAACRRFPLSSADPAVARLGVAGIETSLRNALLWGADAVVIAPAVAEPGTTYMDAWRRSQARLREQILPLARDLEVAVAIDEVWDGFLLAPPEVARYVDALASPWAKACFDTGRVLFYASPQDWIRTLGSRLVTVRARTRLAPADGAGSVDWAAVRRTLDEVGFDGWVTAEAGEVPLEAAARALRQHLVG